MALWFPITGPVSSSSSAKNDPVKQGLTSTTLPRVSRGGTVGGRRDAGTGLFGRFPGRSVVLLEMPPARRSGRDTPEGEAPPCPAAALIVVLAKAPPNTRLAVCDKKLSLGHRSEERHDIAVANATQEVAKSLRNLCESSNPDNRCWRPAQRTHRSSRAKSGPQEITTSGRSESIS